MIIRPWHLKGVYIAAECRTCVWREISRIFSLTHQSCLKIPAATSHKIMTQNHKPIPHAWWMGKPFLNHHCPVCGRKPNARCILRDWAPCPSCLDNPVTKYTDEPERLDPCERCAEKELREFSARRSADDKRRAKQESREKEDEETRKHTLRSKEKAKRAKERERRRAERERSETSKFEDEEQVNLREKEEGAGKEGRVNGVKML